ncbi:mandelate racemase/muconate lactonizing enzyme family protein [Metabacillus iocasae]|uniref:L-alanine-DL-glutamate epimerase-like enolase superfamily enzyme n=1 Tax=Priestia iocasae TaxID=2291674 RepID=A0ABS2QS45_9BACI|nr:enolase C-terminal domain-like protein [Metabacillus iocasae]MBM7702283.1 L-alanine-DL-glutamate epimerase-like enolase superfamily enzyme [Metabacillus iocasae]
MKCRYEVEKLALKTPFISHRGRISDVTQLFITINWNEYEGYGTCLFQVDSNAADFLSESEQACNDILKGHTPFERELVMSEIDSDERVPASLRVALEMALHDLAGKVANLPLYKLWGLDQLSIPQTSLSISSLPEDELLQEVEAHLNWPILKFKITSLSDIQTIGRVRALYKGRIWVDGNGSLNVVEAMEAVKLVERFEVELFEQPIPAGQLHDLQALSSHSSVKIVADEDCCTPLDLIRLVNCVDVINIKLIKCKGLDTALSMIRFAKHLGFEVMLGCKTESVLGVSAIANLAGLADYVDFDGHVDIVNDLFKGVGIEEGTVLLSDSPGLGVSLNR